MQHNLRTLFWPGFITAALITLAGAMIQNNQILAGGAALLGALFILSGFALGVFQHTELILHATKPIPFSQLQRHTVSVAIVVAIFMFCVGAMILYWASQIAGL
ncbi:hypothetical protein PQ472_01920 [Lacticaseibacillus pabuli]|uniref:Uncharacterized protein n=1 Tax=Lacticaseibacillus pabuli TaxID=3025672 RepID=A0ABY7WS58_9LACO|nr:hypothetical protein [Lacticaseibacillus sp. KACC 23028]WDF83025.1 hypothetical protein PQ472_01920 [Lacticaseibacillus sp. KACC 23028]